MAQVSGILEGSNRNKFGFYGLLVDGKWHGAGKKDPGVSKGDFVEFEAYDNAKGYSTIKGEVTKKAAPKSNGATRPAGGREDYWTNKAAVDAAKDPRIAYQGARKIAVTEADFYIRSGAVKLPAKPADVLAALQALVDDTAERIMYLSYIAVEPDLTAETKADTAAVAERASEEEAPFSE